MEKLLKGKSGKQARNFEAAISNQSHPQVKVSKKKTDQTHLLLSMPGLKITDEKRHILEILQTILGGGMSSRLFNEIREKRGLAYYVRASKQSYHDIGNLVVGAGVRNSAATEAVKVIIAELKKLKDKKVAAAELKKAKEMIKGSLALDLESSQEVSQFLASQELFHGELKTPEEIIAKTESVTASQVQEMANELFSYDKLNLAAIGLTKQSDFEKVIEKSKL